MEASRTTGWVYNWLSAVLAPSLKCGDQVRVAVPGVTLEAGLSGFGSARLRSFLVCSRLRVFCWSMV